MQSREAEPLVPLAGEFKIVRRQMEGFVKIVIWVIT